jgi:hypothetical protein
MATFRCLQSGQTVTFENEHDIESMKGHSGYVRIDEESVENQEAEESTVVMRRAGRPRKTDNGHTD